MRLRANWIGLALAALFLALVPTAVALAQDEMPNDEEITLTGRLTYDEAAGGYLLIEQESGDSIAVAGSVDFAEHVGFKVDLTGMWTEDAEGQQFFEVTRIERAE